MARIVFFCIPAWGHTNPTLGVVRELVRRGHQVWYWSYGQLREAIEETGAVFVACDDYDAERRLSPADGARVAKDLAFAAKVLVDTTLALDGAVCREMERLKPDCIVADSMAVWGRAAALKLGIPFISSTTTFAFNRHSSQIMKQSFGDLIRLLISLPKVNKQVKRLRSRGYPVKSILDILQNDNDTHTIVYTSPGFQPRSETFSDRYAFVGPILRPARAYVEKGREKMVYISMGTVNNNLLPVYRACIEALAPMGHRVIMSVGAQVALSEFADLPENVEVHPRVDQVAVLERADVFVTHCGMNSVSEALWFGVPLVLLPQTAEQEGVAARVEELGAGIRPETTAGEIIAGAVASLLEEPWFRAAAAQIGAALRSCGGAAAAADKIESVLQ